MTVVVAIPIKRISVKATIEKGRGWSTFEEIVLWSLSQAPTSASNLAKGLNLPRRVVLEMIVRLMRFRLVEASLAGGSPLFQTTEFGARIVSSGSEIPSARRPAPRTVTFMYDLVTGTVFTRRDIKTKSENDLLALRAQGIDVKDVAVEGTTPPANHAENFDRIQKVLREDETLIGFDSDSLNERKNEFMLITVDEGELRDLPENAPKALVDEIQRVAETKNRTRPIVVSSLVYRDEKDDLPGLTSVNFSDEDLIFGGLEHLAAMKKILSCAKRRIIIHSTFIRLDAFLDLIDDFRNAVRRGVKIDIFWGHGRSEDPGEKTFREVGKLVEYIRQDQTLVGFVRVHIKSTGSHAKIIIADDGESNTGAIIGSCNWLYSSFDRFELSAAIKEPTLVAKVMAALGELLSKNGINADVAVELHVTANALSRRNPSDGQHHARILTGQSHDALLREASGSNPNRFIVASDKFGNFAFSNAIIPAEVAAASSNTKPIVIYSDTTGQVTGADAANLTSEVGERGVRLLRISEGFHAKFLLWGDDDIIITSVNWCSWSTPAEFPYGEIGIHIHRTGIARSLERRLSLIWSQL